MQQVKSLIILNNKINEYFILFNFLTNRIYTFQFLKLARKI